MCKNRIVLFWMLVLGVERVYKWLSVTGKYGDRVRASGRCNQLSDSGLTRVLRQSIGGVLANFSPLILAAIMAGCAEAQTGDSGTPGKEPRVKVADEIYDFGLVPQRALVSNV